MAGEMEYEAEITAAPPEDRAAEIELVRRIRGGEIGLEALPVVKESVAAKLRISSPKLLERYR